MTDPHVLDALARFLGEQVQPALTDAGLGFRVRIAAWLVAGLAREARLGPAHRAAEVEGLAALLTLPPAPEEGPARQAWIEAANAQLAKMLRSDALSGEGLSAVERHVRATLAATLEVVQPTFDRRLDIEVPQAPRAAGL